MGALSIDNLEKCNQVAVRGAFIFISMLHRRPWSIERSHHILVNLFVCRSCCPHPVCFKFIQCVRRAVNSCCDSCIRRIAWASAALQVINHCFYKLLRIGVASNQMRNTFISIKPHSGRMYRHLFNANSNKNVTNGFSLSSRLVPLPRTGS